MVGGVPFFAFNYRLNATHEIFFVDHTGFVNSDSCHCHGVAKENNEMRGRGGLLHSAMFCIFGASLPPRSADLFSLHGN